MAGPPGSGKSTCIQTLIDALSSTPKANMSRASSGSKGSSSSEKMHKLIRINPLVVDESDLMFGYLTPSNDWVDGIFTNACKKANRVSQLVQAKKNGIIHNKTLFHIPNPICLIDF